MVKQEIKEDNSTNIDEQNIAKIVNLRDFPKPLIDSLVTGIIMIELLDPPTDKEVTDINVSNNNKIDSNRQNSLSLIDRVIFENIETIIILIINKKFSLPEATLTDLGVDNINCIQERLIPLKYHERSFERLTQILNYKLPNDHICFETILKDLSSKVILRNPFMALLYPFLTTYEGIKTNVLGKNILLKFILPPIPKEIYTLNNISIIRDIDKERIDRKNRHLESLKSEITYKKNC